MITSRFGSITRDDVSAAFFDATAQGRLLLRRCSLCGRVRAPEIATCSGCLSESFEWIDAAGTGHVESWIVVHGRPDADGTIPEPRVLATVELTEGPWITSALIDIAAGEVAGGLPVQVAFVHPPGSEAIPVFRRA